MVWCHQCQAEVDLEADESNGFSCCVQCGRVVDDTAFSSDVMFTKGADGAGEMVGQMVGINGDMSMFGRCSGGRVWASGGGHEAAVSRGRHEIVALVEALRISPSSEAIEAAHRLYRLALQRSFTKGRCVNQVAAVCLYIFCRLERRPYMLIDFSDHLSVNVYTLGAVFLNMLRLLRLEEHATFTKPIDPSLFMNRFVDRLRLPTHELRTKIGYTATRLVQSMKRDWMLTGRRPNGICGAALFLASHIHGVEKTKMDIISIVHVGWGTVERRVMELAETGGAELTLKEIEERDKALDLEREQMLLEYERAASESAANHEQMLPWPSPSSDATAVGGFAEGDGTAPVVSIQPDATGRCCEHVRAGSPLLAHGMCRQCLQEYLQVTMTVQEGAQNPPAYTRNLRRDVRKRVRAQLEREQPVLLLQGSPAVRAVNDEVDIHQARHLENEMVVDGDMALDAEAAGLSSGHAQASQVLREAGREEARGTGIPAAEEDEFDEALHSSDLQPLAKALGGVPAAVAMAPLQPRKRRDPVDTSVHASWNLELPVKRDRGANEDEDQVGKDVLVGRPVAANPDEGDISTVTRPTGIVVVVGARWQIGADSGYGDEPRNNTIVCDAVAAGDDAVDKDRDGHSSDHLSDVHDDEVAGYLATNEEAGVRRQLWLEMNKDWVEMQEAKKAAEAAESNLAAGERPKRKYTRKKVEVPAAENAAGATRNLLASKKLSDKINYSALADLFGTPTATTMADAMGSSASSLHCTIPGSCFSFQDYASPSTVGSFGKFGAAAAQPKNPNISASRALADDNHASALEDQSRLEGLGRGGFLGSLTFVRGNNEVKGSNTGGRPQGLSIKPRGG